MIAGGLDLDGTPSALNTCFGCVLFGKINGRSDVVDIANHTLAILTASKNKTSGAQDG